MRSNRIFVLAAASLGLLLTACPVDQVDKTPIEEPFPDDYTYSVFISSNGATDGPNTEHSGFSKGDTFQCPSANTFTKSNGATFVEWNTASDRSGTGFQPGDTITAGSGVWTDMYLLLHAIWTDTPLAPGMAMVEEKLWGSWIRMDNGNTFYITSNDVRNLDYDTDTVHPVTVSSGTEFRTGQYTYATVERSPNILKVTSTYGSDAYYLFRKAGKNASAELGINANSASPAIRAIARGLSGIGSIKVIIRNNKNRGDQQEVESGADGSVPFDVVTGDEYTVTIPPQPGVTEEVSATVTPKFDGEDLGFITVGTDGSNFKVSYLLQNGTGSDIYSAGYAYYAFSKQPYTLTVRVTNTGTKLMNAANYSMSKSNQNTDGSSVLSLTGNYSTILGSIPAGKYQDVVFTFTAPSNFTGEQTVYSMPIHIVSGDGALEWDDKVSLKVYKEKMALYLRSDSSTLNGILISPDETSTRIEANPWGGFSREFPKLAEPYTLALSGAGYQTETKYAVGLGKEPETNGSELNWSFNNEQNDTETDATPLHLGEVKLGYLGDGDLDFYTIYPDPPSASTVFALEQDQPLGIALSPDKTVLTAGESITLTAVNAVLAADTSGWTWKVNNTTVTGTNGPSYEFSSAGRTNGDYLVEASIVYGGRTWTASRKLTISKGKLPVFVSTFDEAESPFTGTSGTIQIADGRCKIVVYSDMSTQEYGYLNFNLPAGATRLSFDYGGYSTWGNTLSFKYSSNSTYIELDQGQAQSATEKAEFSGHWSGTVDFAAGTAGSPLVFKYARKATVGDTTDYVWIDNIVMY